MNGCLGRLTVFLCLMLVMGSLRALEPEVESEPLLDAETAALMGQAMAVRDARALAGVEEALHRNLPPDLPTDTYDQRP